MQSSVLFCQYWLLENCSFQFRLMSCETALVTKLQNPADYTLSFYSWFNINFLFLIPSCSFFFSTCTCPSSEFSCFSGFPLLWVDYLVLKNIRELCFLWLQKFCVFFLTVTPLKDFPESLSSRYSWHISKST